METQVAFPPCLVVGATWQSALCARWHPTAREQYNDPAAPRPLVIFAREMEDGDVARPPAVADAPWRVTRASHAACTAAFLQSSLVAIDAALPAARGFTALAPACIVCGDALPRPPLPRHPSMDPCPGPPPTSASAAAQEHAGGGVPAADQDAPPSKERRRGGLPLPTPRYGWRA